MLLGMMLSSAVTNPTFVKLCMSHRPQPPQVPGWARHERRGLTGGLPQWSGSGLLFIGQKKASLRILETAVQAFSLHGPMMTAGTRHRLTFV